MTRYYFNLSDGVEVPDLQGLELGDLAAARDAALRGARDILASEVREGNLPLHEKIHVTDESGTVLFVQNFRDAVVIQETEDPA